MMKRKGPEKEANNERWLLTYSDLITLLMIFFVIMYASSNIDSAKYKAMAQSFNIAMGGGKNVIKMGDDPASDDTLPTNTTVKPTPKPAQVDTEQQKMSDIKAELDKYLGQNGLTNSVTTNITERGLVVSLKDSAFFDSGQAIILPEFESKLIAIAKIVNKLDNYIRIEGHTDNVPIHNSYFDSNWDLSAIRATNVVKLVISAAGIPPTKISAIGYGETRPIGSNSTAAGRAKNRRVDIVVLSNKYSSEEKAVNN